MDAGFDRDHIVSFTLDPRIAGYGADEARLLSETLLERARSLPSAAAAGIANRAIMRGSGLKATFARAGDPIRKEDFLNSRVNEVTPGCFETMGMRLVADRDFTPFDHTERELKRVIVNQAFERQIFPDGPPIGGRLGVGAPDTVAAPGMEIIGVVSDAEYRSLREPAHPNVYNLLAGGFQYGFTLYVRTHRQAEEVIGPVRNILYSLDPELPLVEVHTLRQEVEASVLARPAVDKRGPGAEQSTSPPLRGRSFAPEAHLAGSFCPVPRVNTCEARLRNHALGVHN